MPAVGAVAAVDAAVVAVSVGFIPGICDMGVAVLGFALGTFVAGTRTGAAALDDAVTWTVGRGADEVACCVGRTVGFGGGFGDGAGAARTRTVAVGIIGWSAQ